MKKKNKRRPSTIIISICISLIIVFSIGFVGLCAANHFLNKINRPDTDTETISPENEFFDVEEGATDTIDFDSLELNEVEPLKDEALLNILLIGQDRREGEYGRTRSDTMILVSVNMKTHQVSLTSFLRDLYVLLPGYTANRMNAAYVFGGYDLLEQVMLTNFGIHLDGYFEVDFSEFIKVIDAVGGVDIYLTEAEADIVGGGAVQGINHLNGRQALSYARIRKLDSDFGRTERQRAVLTSLFNEVKEMPLNQILSLVDTVLPILTTNLTNIDIASYAAKFAPYITDIKISTHTVPSDGQYVNETVRGMAVLVPDLNRIRDALINEYLPLN